MAQNESTEVQPPKESKVQNEVSLGMHMYLCDYSFVRYGFDWNSRWGKYWGINFGVKGESGNGHSAIVTPISALFYTKPIYLKLCILGYFPMKGADLDVGFMFEINAPFKLDKHWQLGLYLGVDYFLYEGIPCAYYSMKVNYII